MSTVKISNLRLSLNLAFVFNMNLNLMSNYLLKMYDVIPVIEIQVIWRRNTGHMM